MANSKDMKTSIATKVSNLTSVIGCIVDEWTKEGEAITLDELRHIYDDITEINEQING